MDNFELGSWKHAELQGFVELVNTSVFHDHMAKIKGSTENIVKISWFKKKKKKTRRILKGFFNFSGLQELLLKVIFFVFVWKTKSVYFSGVTREW